ncbi:MAG: mercury methylation ferredoxin HgcB [Actinomycetota bacterium]|nr:mercury methylation ferredoxin HgcB [Actinomycetota bacterium]
MSGLRYIEAVVTLKLDEAACTGCKVCTQVCPRGVLSMSDGKAVIVDLGACIECGACARNCAFGALSVDAGVGCAEAIIYGWIHGTEPDCSSGCCG